jgi:hypothetical protein
MGCLLGEERRKKVKDDSRDMIELVKNYLLMVTIPDDYIIAIVQENTRRGRRRLPHPALPQRGRGGGGCSRP